MIRVLVVDDHQMFAQSLTRLFELEDDIDVCAMAFSGSEAVTLAAQHRPDVCILDYQLPDGVGTVIAPALRATAPDVRIVMITGVARPTTAAAAADAGCDAFVTKDRAADELVRTVRAVHDGDRPIAADVAAAARNRSAAADGAGLTPRELDVLVLLATGASSADIAAHFTVSTNTLRTHVQRILAKLGAHSKLEAVAIARDNGVL